MYGAFIYLQVDNDAMQRDSNDILLIFQEIPAWTGF